MRVATERLEAEARENHFAHTKEKKAATVRETRACAWLEAERNTAIATLRAELQGVEEEHGKSNAAANKMAQLRRGSVMSMFKAARQQGAAQSLTDRLAEMESDHQAKVKEVEELRRSIKTLEADNARLVAERSREETDRQRERENANERVARLRVGRRGGAGESSPR